MSLGLTWEKLIVILVIAGLLIGPERLPRYAEGLAHLVGKARDYLRGARSRVKDELGDGFDDVDWRTLDPRRYDPRRIIREALLDDAPLPTVPTGSASRAAPVVGAAAAVAAPGAAGATTPVREPFRPGGEAAPFDSEAT